MNKIWLFIVMVFATSATAEECTNVISLSKLVSTTVEDKSSFEAHAENFCKEYNKSKGTTRSSSFGASYKFLSASMGKSGASSETIASKFCSASDSTKHSDNAYRRYVETISPNAYSAYQQCLKLSKQDVKFDLSIVLPKQFSMLVSFHPKAFGATAKMAYKPSDGIECNWHEIDKTKVVLNSGESKLLSCKREDSLSKAYVIVLREDGVSQSMTIPWQSYTNEGVPVDLVRNLTDGAATIAQENIELKATLAKLSSQSKDNKNYISKLKSTPNKAVEEIVSHDGFWGDWKSVAMCPVGQYVCGFRSRIEKKQKDGDDTAMNGVRLKCCSF